MRRRILRRSCLIALAIMMPTLNWAGTTGKLTGTVTDTDGSPLPGVAVTVVGSRLGATTDTDGLYVILQVTPGEVVVNAQLIGYQSVSVTEVEVFADRTTTIDFQLREEAIQMEALVVTAERPPIEVDVTSSQITVDAQRVAEAPVVEMLDFLNYEPGISVARDNELEIRGGGPSEIRWQVDGLDRTDALTGKAYTQLNQVLVAETTVLTGGFNAEYGNVRSGMVNVVMKDGTEHGTGLPWIAGVYGWAPAQKKHFGPGAYDEDQYDYWLISSKSPIADSAMNSALYWPFIYDQTRDDPQFNDPTDPRYRNPRTSSFLVFGGRTAGQYLGWQQKAALANAKNFVGYYGKGDWTPEEVREAWEWETNMNEQVWQYSHNPDWNVDLAGGWSLPRKMGGIVLGYRQKYEMTLTPALRPYFRDESFESKLTLTPTDRLKIRMNYMFGTSESTGAGSKGGANNNPELAQTSVGGTIGADPVSLRSSGDLINTVNGLTLGNNKLNLAYNSYLDGDFTQFGISTTYTFSANTYFTASFGRTRSTWGLDRSLPRANPNDFTSTYVPPTTWGMSAWYASAYAWSDISNPPDKIGDPPVSIDDATTEGRAIFRNPFVNPNIYSEIPTTTVWITKDFYFVGSDGIPDTVTVVSPQGLYAAGYPDLSQTYMLGQGGEVWMEAAATQIVAKADLTHAVGNHTIKTGAEFIGGDLEYNTVQSEALYGTQYTDFRSYGGEWPAAEPKIIGLYLQDKMETHGMIANVGLRVERYDAGQYAFIDDSLFNSQVIEEHARPQFVAATIALGWDTTAWGPVPQITNWQVIEDSLTKIGSHAPRPGEIYEYIPHADNKVHWKFAPRFGISHPVTERAKFFFNYGVFYSMQKPAVMYGMYDHDGRMGGPGNVREIYGANLRPAQTTMYEVGVENVFPLGFVLTARGYAKYNTDQSSRIEVIVGGDNYDIYRNANWEDIRGAEVKISRSIGRFVNGWFSYEQSTSRSGEVGYNRLTQNITNATQFSAFARTSRPEALFRAMIMFSTPRDWGPLRGGWSLSIVQAYQSGGEVLYNPDPQVFSVRDLTKEYYLPVVDYWNTDLKLSKSFTFAGRRTMSVYMDITNLLNEKRLNLSSTEYTRYIYFERLKGRDVMYGDESNMFTEPYLDEKGYWQAPISPRLDWLKYLNPRYYRFGVRFEL